MQDIVNPAETLGASLIARPLAAETMEVHGRYTVECVRDGRVIWTEEFDNLVTTVGKNSLLDKFLDLGSAHSAIHMGLKSAGTALAADTMASHSSWTEPSIVAARLVPAFSAAASGSKATSAAVSFSI